MKLKLIAAAAALITASSFASATTSWDLGSYTVTYDQTTSFGALADAYTSGGGAVGFHWNFSPDVQVTSVGGSVVSATFALPDFTISANPGWTIGGDVTGSMGNVVYAEFGASTTSISVAASVSVDGSPAFALPLTSLTKVPTGGGTLGYFADTATLPIGTFSTFTVNAGSITLNASGGFAAAIGAQPQNTLAFSFTAHPVPEPETYALLLSGLGVVGWIARRRRQR